MSERKYRQRGYQDEPKPTRQEKPKGEPTPREFRTPNMPGFKQTTRCTRCGNVLSAEVAHDSRCNRCGVDLWACIHCESFDSGARLECGQPIPARVTPKDVRNTCTLFHPTVRVERETGFHRSHRRQEGVRRFRMLLSSEAKLQTPTTETPKTQRTSQRDPFGGAPRELPCGLLVFFVSPVVGTWT